MKVLYNDQQVNAVYRNIFIWVKIIQVCTDIQYAWADILMITEVVHRVLAVL